jgi:hypothetical protein
MGKLPLSSAPHAVLSQIGATLPALDRTLPGPGQRLRCAACGNLTRFDVRARRRSSAYWHYSLAGELTVEDESQLEVEVELLRCRWCGSEDAVEIVPAPAGAAAREPSGP